MYESLLHEEIKSVCNEPIENKTETVTVEFPEERDLDKVSLEKYLSENGWGKELGLWRHKSGHAPILNLEHLAMSLKNLAYFESRATGIVYLDIMK